MTKEARNPNDPPEADQSGGGVPTSSGHGGSSTRHGESATFGLRHSSFLRHSGFDIRHSPARPRLVILNATCLDLFERRMRERLGQQIEVHFEIVPQIPLEAGKMRYFRCDIPPLATAAEPAVQARAALA